MLSLGHRAYQGRKRVSDITPEMVGMGPSDGENIMGIMTEKEQKFVEAYNEKIRKEERERIIELLELNLDCEFTDYDYLGFRDHSEYCRACEIIALIRGENK